MSLTLVLGALFGDEGKGRVARELARDFDVACRANGGPNASHTIYEGEDKWVLRQVPTGVFTDAVCVLADGMLVDVLDLVEELEALEEAGLDTSRVYRSASSLAPTASARAPRTRGSPGRRPPRPRAGCPRRGPASPGTRRPSRCPTGRIATTAEAGVGELTR
jgi:hypothetical protein